MAEETFSVPAFALSDVAFDYEDGSTALRAVSLVVAPGERVAVLGANGSGKSTLLRIMGGLLLPSAGSIHAFGVELTRRALDDPAISRPFRRRVGLLFQNADAQLFAPTVREEIAFGPLQMDLPAGEVERRVSDVARLAGISGLLDRPPFRLSGGEKKRVAIASVLAIGPRAILLDEPTGGLDPRTRSWLLGFLGALHEAGTTLVSATNDLEAVPGLGERVVVLNEGHGIEAAGPVETILRDSRLLQSVNVIHEHGHEHGGRWHVHPHFHAGNHEHDHDA